MTLICSIGSFCRGWCVPHVVQSSLPSSKVLKLFTEHICCPVSCNHWELCLQTATHRTGYKTSQNSKKHDISIEKVFLFTTLDSPSSSPGPVFHDIKVHRLPLVQIPFSKPWMFQMQFGNKSGKSWVGVRWDIGSKITRDQETCYRRDRATWKSPVKVALNLMDGYSRTSQCLMPIDGKVHIGGWEDFGLQIQAYSLSNPQDS